MFLFVFLNFFVFVVSKTIVVSKIKGRTITYVDISTTFLIINFPLSLCFSISIYCIESSLSFIGTSIFLVFLFHIKISK
uniref:Uncharacterized protein n=1 Tax=Cucumis melo TaxID=3656 RepID=A0A9I9DH77_CUCME